MLEKLPELVGHALRDQRAGLDTIAFHLIDVRQGMAALAIQSLAFPDHGRMPTDYTADGPGVSPPLQWTGVPAKAESLVLIVEDVDTPMPQPMVHAIVVDLPGADGALPAGALQSPDHDGTETLKTGRNSLLQSSWLPPDPPPGHGPHRYAFQLFALAGGEPFRETPGRAAVIDVLRERAIASGCLIGVYERGDGSIRIDASGVAVPQPESPVAV